MNEFRIKDSFLRKYPEALVGRCGRVRNGWVHRPMNNCFVKILGYTGDGRYMVEFPFPIPFSGKRTMYVP